MDNVIVRIKSITIKNFKNVSYGTISLENTRKNYKASILGLYGQNGSGKTALIESIALLQCVLCGQSVPSMYADYINVDEDFSQLEYEFVVNNKEKNEKYNVNYRFKIKSEAKTTSHNTENSVEISTDTRVGVFDEILSYSYECGEEKIRMSKIIDTHTEDVFVPKAKASVLVGNQNITDLLVGKKMAYKESRSFIFSAELLDCIRKNCGVSYHINLLNAIVNFGNFELFIIDTRNSGLISMDALPISFKYDSGSSGAFGTISILLNDSMLIPEDAYILVDSLIKNMNIVLKQLIPNLTIGIKIIAPQTMPNGETGYVIELLSQKNNKAIPLRYESEGIKKIISILQLLIVVYNKKSITVAIDELDSGVFEYLLGEILRIISEKGKGQLIFTSHNLRPLETIDRGFIAFTTTNPKNRYIRFSNVKSNNNLRDFYYRDIVLGEQDERVYEPTNNQEIAFAFREAGEISGS